MVASCHTWWIGFKRRLLQSATGHWKLGYPLPLHMPLRTHRWAWVDAVWRGMSPDLALWAGEESVFLCATAPLLLSINHNCKRFCQVTFPHMSESTKHTKFEMAPVDSPLKAAYDLLSLQFIWVFLMLVVHRARYQPIIIIIKDIAENLSVFCVYLEAVI